MAQVTESDYETVRKSGKGTCYPNPRIAQEFLEAVDLEGARGYVRSLKYKERQGNDWSLGITHYKNGKAWAKLPSIEVTQNVFYRSFPFFLSIVVDHEAEEHAKRYAITGKKRHLNDYCKVSRATGDDMLASNLHEILACLNQLVVPNRRDLFYHEYQMVVERIESKLRKLPSMKKARAGLDILSIGLPAEDFLRENLFELMRNRKSSENLELVLSKFFLTARSDDVVRERYGL